METRELEVLMGGVISIIDVPSTHTNQEIFEYLRDEQAHFEREEMLDEEERIDLEDLAIRLQYR